MTLIKSRFASSRRRSNVWATLLLNPKRIARSCLPQNRLHVHNCAVRRISSSAQVTPRIDLDSVEPESVTEHSTRERTDVGNCSDPESAIRKCGQGARCLVCLVIREIQSCEGGGKMAFTNFLVAVNRRSLRVALDVRKVNGHPEVGDLDVSVRERSAVGVHASPSHPRQVVERACTSYRGVCCPSSRAAPTAAAV